MQNSRILIIIVESKDQFEYDIFPHCIDGVLCAMCVRVYFCIRVLCKICLSYSLFINTKAQCHRIHSYKKHDGIFHQGHRLCTSNYEKYSMFYYNIRITMSLYDLGNSQ